MILTVTANSALDRLLFIDEFRPGTTMRPHKMVDYVGGKGFDTSVVLQTLGVKNKAIGFVAGSTGRELVELLDGYGISHDLIWVDGETRIAHIIVETRRHRHSHLIAAGLSVPPQAYQALLKRYQNYLDEAAWVVVGGSIAEGMPISCYRQLAEMARAAAVPILIDSFGVPLLAALPAAPAIVKMNWDEFGQTFDPYPATLDDLAEQAQALQKREQLPALVITCGGQGVLALTAEGSYLTATPPQLAVNASGAGDGISAALAWRLSLGDSWPEALRWAAATGAAIVLTEGTAECYMVDIERLLSQTTVQPI
ncbi:MAG: hexose kinase [Anaerolineae bacterium]|nr:hexose kinase [Anaerolineae bacterium]